MNERMTQSLVIRALFRVVDNMRPTKGVVLHSDRDSQYRARYYQKLLTQFSMMVSMSCKSDCRDNALMESF